MVFKMSQMTERLIELVKKYPVLYDSSDSDYKNARKKDKVWGEVGAVLGKDAEDVKKKWKNLRDSYGKFLRSEKTRFGQKAKILHRYRTWPWADRMAEFKPFLKYTQAESNEDSQFDVLTESDHDFSLHETKIDELDDHQPEALTSNYSQSFKKPKDASGQRKRTRQEAVEELPSPKKILSHLKEQETIMTESFGDIDLICLGYARTIKKFSPRRQIITKFKIAKIIMQEELAEQMENDIEREAQITSRTINTDLSHCSNNFSLTSPDSNTPIPSLTISRHGADADSANCYNFGDTSVSQ